ncbi:MAG: ABC transporter substrate-binding protein [Proteobacteria bacterium]|nr:ABC transporter substrate-binding protein [Pseudomonadota bacterium]MCP4919177.1 ABC transporter substrate-binding protein [Pseudomonadota bacterium]
MILALALACSTPEPTTAIAPAATLEPNRDEPALIPIRLALNWFPEAEFGGFYEGVLGGHYERAGFAVEIIPGGPGAPTLQLIESGQAEVAITAADDLLIKRSKRAKAVGVWPAFQLAPNGLMVHEAGAASFEDISGTVAIEPGSPFEAFLSAQYTWDDRGVTRVPYSGSIGPFLTDPTFVQQAYITSEPCVARSKGAATRFLKASDAGWNPYGTLVAVATPAPDWTEDFVAATQTSWQAYIDAPDRANARMSELNPDMTPELLACVSAAQAEFLTGTDGLGAMTEERWETMNRQLEELGLVPKDNPWRQAFLATDAPVATGTP